MNCAWNRKRHANPASDRPLGTAKFAIAWPCAGIESLLIFTAVALLFLQRMPMSWKAKIGYFAVGAGITYFINVFELTPFLRLECSMA